MFTIYRVHNPPKGVITVRTVLGIYEWFDNLEDAEKFADDMNRAYNRGYQDAWQKSNPQTPLRGEGEYDEGSPRYRDDAIG